jgi:hypothetical protein
MSGLLLEDAQFTVSSLTRQPAISLLICRPFVNDRHAAVLTNSNEGVEARFSVRATSPASNFTGTVRTAATDRGTGR